ncbi:hypothetical protein TPB0596_43850 [Tsukamurella pulmonis]|uniref:hypothetical protein n=1 Tax=Tsukamurella pulmonis TaxID=47312 RepID=UPI001EDF789A|nr:hypothetical protein [Tsukamurella pulmonis]BDD84622.1 hypothetical protein TPB0596_43850 [Tsukamurella pulmonis]
MFGFRRERTNARAHQREPADAFVALEKGAVQVYDAETSAVNSAVVSAMTGRKARVLAGNWTGVQFWVDDDAAAGDDSAMVFMLDPSTMIVDDFVEQGRFVAAILEGSIVAGMEAELLRSWLAERSMESLAPNTCVPVHPQQFLTGSVDARPLSTDSVSTTGWLIHSAKALRVMHDLELQAGDPLPADFTERVAEL